MYPKVLLTNHWMEDNLETHLEEVDPEEIRLENHLSFHSLDLIDGNTGLAYVHTPWYQPLVVQHVSKPTTKLPYKKLQYPTYVKDTNSNVYIKVFKKPIKANGETMEANIINLFGFTLEDSIFEWGENYFQNHPNCTFEELE